MAWLPPGVMGSRAVGARLFGCHDGSDTDYSAGDRLEWTRMSGPSLTRELMSAPGPALTDPDHPGE